MADVAKAIAKLKGHKAPGLDNVLPETLKYGGTAVAEVHHGIILEAWRSEHAPPDFKRDVVIPIPKKAGADNCKNCRTLALQIVAAKVYAMVLRERFSKWLEHQLVEPQYRFRPGRGCADALCSLRSLCSLAWNKNKTLYICRLDLAKASDSADREPMWRVLVTRGAPPKLVALLRDLHTDHVASHELSWILQMSI